MINRPLDLIPHQLLIDELIRLYRLDPHWIELSASPDVEGFACRLKYSTWLERAMFVGNDYMSSLCLSTWLGSGPKIFRPTIEQCMALEQIQVNLHMRDYSQPYPALLVEYPAERYGNFTSTVVYHWPEKMALALYSARAATDRSDMATVVSGFQTAIENALVKYEADCADLGESAVLATRVAVNCCLALMHYGCQHAAMFPKELANDQHYAREQTPRGERARQRVATAPKLVTFTQDVVLYRRGRSSARVGEPTGREMPPHWRRGHWQAHPGYGEARARGERVPMSLIPPLMVRADRFIGDDGDTTTIYTGR